jgi:hypothetical protein
MSSKLIKTQLLDNMTHKLNKWSKKLKAHTSDKKWFLRKITDLCILSEKLDQMQATTTEMDRSTSLDLRWAQWLLEASTNMSTITTQPLDNMKLLMLNLKLEITPLVIRSSKSTMIELLSLTKDTQEDQAKALVNMIAVIWLVSETILKVSLLDWKEIAKSKDLQDLVILIPKTHWSIPSQEPLEEHTSLRKMTSKKEIHGKTHIPKTRKLTSQWTCLELQMLIEQLPRATWTSLSLRFLRKLELSSQFTKNHNMWMLNQQRSLRAALRKPKLNAYSWWVHILKELKLVQPKTQPSKTLTFLNPQLAKIKRSIIEQVKISNFKIINQVTF